MALVSEEGGGQRSVIVGPTAEELRRWRRRRRRIARLNELERQRVAALNAPGTVVLTESQRKALSPEQLRQFRQLNQQEQLRFQRELAADIARYRREVAEAQQQARRARARAERKRGASYTSAALFRPPGGNPMDAVLSYGTSLAMREYRRRPGSREDTEVQA